MCDRLIPTSPFQNLFLAQIDRSDPHGCPFVPISYLYMGVFLHEIKKVWKKIHTFLIRLRC